jgi:predicted nucleotidyltransferase
LLAALPDAWAIYAYGSFARGDEWPLSDLDLAVLLAPGKTIGDPLGLSSALAARAGRDIDLVDLRTSGDTLRAEVLRAGRALFVADAELVLEWEAAAMSRYARHREQIRDLLADFAQTGVGYA